MISGYFITGTAAVPSSGGSFIETFKTNRNNVHFINYTPNTPSTPLLGQPGIAIAAADMALSSCRISEHDHGPFALNLFGTAPGNEIRTMADNAG